MNKKQNKKETSKTFGEYLKMLREARNLSQEDVAFELNIERSSYSHYETNQTMPSIPMLRNIAKVFDVPVITLFNLTDPDEVPFDIVIEEANAIAEYEKKVGPNTPFKNLSLFDKRMLYYTNTLLKKDESEEMIDFFRNRYKRNYK